MDNTIDPDAILRERLGPTPREVLEKLLANYPDMLAVAVVVQRADESLVLAAGGCTVMETAGMLQYGMHGAAASLWGDTERT